ncbi:LysR family transcriptional regulator [Notoacmeibacter sp. MSK16QG-6]|uniref:LysR family transcriptional regulator n=1 Tax=Notoacmeibacter sp. MSK16QG-6 TaxID=2957982 RepID=UPI00209EFD5A|nr:LysR family transcriptional regulator [Notoacmeibacter sp. MSK16QG-6]MCP1199836.1 LysR family transcriptional regulator [Notoacmeibacter sp. MSK16QG-6]
MPVDWDKLRVFHAAAQAGSFTHAADTLNLSQSAISRQVSALEHEIGVSLFHRHARGLVLTEAGEILFKTAQEVLLKLETVRSSLTESKDKPSGTLRVTTTVGLGTGWLAKRVDEFMNQYPDVQLQLLFSNEELDLTMREADCAIRLRQPQQPDLIQRKLFTVHFHLWASEDYIRRNGQPQTLEALQDHTLITFGEPVIAYLRNLNWLETVELSNGEHLQASLQMNDLNSIRSAVKRGLGIAMLPDYIIDRDSGFVHILPEIEVPTFDTFFVYAEAMRSQAKLEAFRDFMFAKARRWNF